MQISIRIETDEGKQCARAAGNAADERWTLAQLTTNLHRRLVLCMRLMTN